MNDHVCPISNIFFFLWSGRLGRRSIMEELRDELRELKAMFNEMLALLEDVMQTGQTSEVRTKVTALRTGLQRRSKEEEPEHTAKEVEPHPWEGLTYEQAFHDPQHFNRVLPLFEDAKFQPKKCPCVTIDCMQLKMQHFRASPFFLVV